MLNHPSTRTSGHRVALIGNAIDTMLRFRGALIESLVAEGHEVIALCPPGPPEQAAALRALGARHLPIHTLSRGSLNPRGELLLLRELTMALRRERPDHVFSFFLKPLIWGTLAGRAAGVAHVTGMIEGMGFAFSARPPDIKGRLKQAIAQRALLPLLRRALARIDHLMVLNQDDEAFLLDRGLITSDRLIRLDGIGVDLEHFAFAQPHLSPPRFTLVARMIREKGVELFIAAARQVRAQYPEAQFCLVGGVDDAPGALSTAYLSGLHDSGLIEWRGHVSDVRTVLTQTSVFVLPTLYREGLPRSIMEAMAMGRPVITTARPGARGSVTPGVSGVILELGPQDRMSETLRDACVHFLRTPDIIASMGRAARDEAEKRYDLGRKTLQQNEVILDKKERTIRIGAV